MQPGRAKAALFCQGDNEMVREQYLKRIEQAFETAIENARYAQIQKEELVGILEALLHEE